MKISMLGTLPPVKGISYYCWFLCRSLAAKVNLEFFTFSHLYPEFLYPGGTKDDKVSPELMRNQNFKIFSSINFYNPLSWIRTALKISGDAVHAQFWSLPIVPVWVVIFLILKLRHKKIIVTIHNVLPHESSGLDKLLTRMILRFGDFYLVHAKQNADMLSRIFRIPMERIAQVPMGPYRAYTKSESMTRQQARKWLGLDQNAKVLLQFGNIRDYKGVDDFIRVVALLKTRLHQPIIGLIVGQSWGSFKKYDELVSSLGLDNEIKIFPDYIPDACVTRYFYASDVLLLPYKDMNGQSAVGNIAIELGIPLVVTRVGGLPDLLLNKDFVVEPNQPAQMAEKAMQILTKKHVAIQLKKDADKLRRLNSWDKAAEQTVIVYKSLLNR